MVVQGAKAVAERGQDLAQLGDIVFRVRAKQGVNVREQQG